MWVERVASTRRVAERQRRRSANRILRRVVTGPSLAFELFLFAPLKFCAGGILGWPSYREKFGAWGYAGWFLYVVGTWELIAAVLLLMPRRRFLGAVRLVLVLTGAIATHLIDHDTISHSIAAPIHLVLATIITLSRWPADWSTQLAPPNASIRFPMAYVGWQFHPISDPSMSRPSSRRRR